MMSKRGILLAVAFILPIISCLVGIGAFVNLTVNYQQVEQEQQTVMYQQLTEDRNAVNTLKETLHRICTRISELQSERTKEENLASAVHKITEETKQLELSARTMQSKLQSLDIELGQVQSDLLGLKDESRKLSEIQSTVEDLNAKLAEVAREHELLTSAVDVTQKKIEERKNGVLVTSLSGGSSPHIQSATFVECTAQGVILQPQKKEQKKVPDKNDRKAFLAAARITRYVVFLIRPDGFESFDQYHNLILSENKDSHDPIDIGYEPVNADWNLVYPES
jgi:myosin heavy subunit